MPLKAFDIFFCFTELKRVSRPFVDPLK